MFAKLRLIHSRGFFHRLIQRFLVIYLRSGIRLLWRQLYSRGLRQGLNRLAKLHALVIHDETEGIATSTATKAVIELLLRID